MRIGWSFFAILLTLTLVSRAAFPASQFYLSSVDNHTHGEDLADIHNIFFLNGMIAHEHEHDHEHQHDDKATPDDSPKTSLPSDQPNGHSHSHTHVAFENTAWANPEVSINSTMIAPQVQNWSVTEDTYFFNFLSRIFRPPIS